MRLAGVHAIAGLADDWTENKQTCVDILCAYLRMAHESEPADDAPADNRLKFQIGQQICHTIIWLIGMHLRSSATASRQGLNFDFTGVRFDVGDFRGAVFSGGTVSFDDARFSRCTVSFTGARYSGGRVDLRYPSDWSHPPAFSFSGAPPDGLLLPDGRTR